MTRNEAASIIEARLGNRSGLTSRIYTEMQLRQGTEWERSAVLPWFLLKESSGLVTVASTRTVALPSDFLREYDEGQIWLTDTDGYKNQLVKDTHDRLTNRFSPDGGETDSNQPDSYAIVGTNLYLFPLADAAYSLSMFYYAAATALTTDIENLWLQYAADYVIADVGLLVARHLRDSSAVELFEGDLKMAKSRLMIDNVARSQTAMAAYMGG